VPDESRLRLNFESQFQKYEGNIKPHTESLLSKLNAGNHDVRAEIINLFAAKLLNFVRNPFSIVKVLNTFPGLDLRRAAAAHAPCSRLWKTSAAPLPSAWTTSPLSRPSV
jgi:hypothetical protein